jgi:hypothetical protein
MGEGDLLEIEAGPPKGVTPTNGPLYFDWSAVYGLNLILPLLYGWSMTNDGGRVGMFAMIAMLYAFGIWACRSNRSLGIVLTVGGGIVALTQLFPAPQIFAGMIGTSIANRIEGVAKAPDDVTEDINTVLGGVIATGMTGGLLILLALVLGAIFWGLGRSVTRENHNSGPL